MRPWSSGECEGGEGEEERMRRGGVDDDKGTEERVRREGRKRG